MIWEVYICKDLLVPAQRRQEWKRKFGIWARRNSHVGIFQAVMLNMMLTDFVSYLVNSNFN